MKFLAKMLFTVAIAHCVYGSGLEEKAAEVTLIANDGERCENVSLEAALMSGLVKNILAGDMTAKEIHINKVSGPVLKRVVVYLHNHAGEDHPARIIPKPLNFRSLSERAICNPLYGTLGNLENNVSGFDMVFIDSDPGYDLTPTTRPRNILTPIINAANYMDIPGLVQLGCAKIATFLKENPENFQWIEENCLEELPRELIDLCLGYAGMVQVTGAGIPEVNGYYHRREGSEGPPRRHRIPHKPCKPGASYAERSRAAARRSPAATWRLRNRDGHCYVKDDGCCFSRFNTHLITPSWVIFTPDREICYIGDMPATQRDADPPKHGWRLSALRALRAQGNGTLASCGPMPTIHK